MLKAYKYRIYPTKEQAAMFIQTFNATRLVYNLALEVKQIAFKEHGVRLSKYDLGNQLPELKKEFPWLAEVNSQSLHEAIHDMDNAFQNFFKNGKGFPKFKAKREKQSYSCTQHSKVDWDNSMLTILKIPNIPIILHRKFEGKIKTVTISRTSTGKYYASILVDNDLPLPLKKEINVDTAIGIDMGIRHLAILSDGRKFDNPELLKKSLDRLKVLDRRVAKKQKGSENRKKAMKQVAILHEKIANQRKAIQHSLSSAIVKQYDTVCVETLNIRKMQQQLNMGFAIGDAAWGEFIRMLEYKANWHGKNLLKIDLFAPSSKMCSNCCSINQKLKPMLVRNWECPSCGVKHDVDINAAINVKEIALELSGWCSSIVPVELPAMVGTVKQERLPLNVNAYNPSGFGTKMKHVVRLKMKVFTNHLVKGTGRNNRKGRVSVDSG